MNYNSNYQNLLYQLKRLLYLFFVTKALIRNYKEIRHEYVQSEYTLYHARFSLDRFDRYDRVIALLIIYRRFTMYV